MDWITKASNERNATRQQRDVLLQKALALRDNLCHGIEQAVKDYNQMEGEFLVESTGPSNHTISVWVFEQKAREKGGERERLAALFNRETLAVVVHLSSGQTKYFPMSLNVAGNTCLTVEGKEIPIEKFTELATARGFSPLEGEQ